LEGRARSGIGESRGMTKRVRKTKAAKTTADYAMPEDRFDLWLRTRATMETGIVRRPIATSLSMLDGFVAAIVAGPVSLSPPDWICPLIGVAPDAFNHDNEEFSAIAATAIRHNVISETLSTDPKRFEPIFIRDASGGVDPHVWCQGFYIAMNLRLLDWHPLLRADAAYHHLLRPILHYGAAEGGRSALDPAPQVSGTKIVQAEIWREIAPAVEAIRQYWQPVRFKQNG
jgi:yecA family protein